jgi:acetyltransferase-like isoleucine patch superfamily enzyme
LVNPKKLFEEVERNQKLRSQILTYVTSQMMTDDERAELLGLPEGCRMRENAKIISPENFKCGKHVWIGEGAILDASGGLEIGDHTSIGLYVMVWTHESTLTNLTLDNSAGNPIIKRKPTKIGKGCFVAGHSVIYPGTTVGDFVVILPMTAITKDVPSYSIVAGAPAKVIKKLSPEEIDKMVTERMKEIEDEKSTSP